MNITEAQAVQIEAGRRAYAEYRECMRLSGLYQPELWDTLSSEGKALWCNVASAVIVYYTAQLPRLLKGKE